MLHTAHYPLGEAIIRYKFHPRCGETVIITGRNRRGDEVSLTIRQPDGTLAQLPIWMTEDQAAVMTVSELPHLSLACLSGLRHELDTCLSLLRDDSRREGNKHATVEPMPSRSLRSSGTTGATTDASRTNDAATSSTSISKFESYHAASSL